MRKKNSQALIASKLLFRNIGYLPIALRMLRKLKKDKPVNFKTIDYLENIDEERIDIIDRARWLCREVCVSPKQLINKLPEIVGHEVQNEWAMYACSMTCFALSNIIQKWPDCREEFEPYFSKLINLVLSPELRYYDIVGWGEDPLENLESNKSHMTYLSILTWMITEYKKVKNVTEYDSLLDNVCGALYRRMRLRKDLNLPSFANGIVFLPDMMFTLISLKNYWEITKTHKEYKDIVNEWLDFANKNLIDPETGLLISLYYPSGITGKMMGSYSGLNCSCLALIDEDFGREQYEKFKKYFGRFGKYCAVNEYLDAKPELSFHIDAGPIVYGISPTGIAFSMGAATYFGDWKFRQGMLNTCELAGHTVKRKGTRHYKLAEIMITGEAITLGMRTMVK